MTDSDTPTDRFRERLYALNQHPTEPVEPLDLSPASTFEALTRQMVETLVEEVREIRTRLNSLVFMMVGAMLLDVIARIVAP